jgi:predicted DNA-binding protein with PD1-like motif
VIVLEVRHAELMESITKQAAERGITYGAIVALIGAVDSFTVSTPPIGDPTAHLFRLLLADRDYGHQ